MKPFVFLLWVWLLFEVRCTGNALGFQEIRDVYISLEKQK